MLLKSCELPYRLKYYQSLSGRASMSRKQIKDQAIYQAGYHGECLFAEMIRSYEHATVLWDITLSNEKGESQFDFIVIHDYSVFHYDIKNFKGKYQQNGDILVSQTGYNVKRPDMQLSCAHNVLEAAVKSYDWQYEVESYLVFINETFYFEGVRSPHWLYRSLLKQHLAAYENSHLMLSRNKQLGQFLINNHQPNVHLDVPIKTAFSEVADGLKCPLCLKKITITFDGKKYYSCPICKKVVSGKELLLSNLCDLYYLKGAPFSIREAESWCNSPSRTTLKRLLKANFKSTGQKKAVRYYLEN
ncbi:nuclease-related domain-containing protein [Macrococcus lamae]|uniref:NERD domain-containing protein n=1 Tax=Macrococcus lamae TaxID=198484 RepID=A0A4R6BUX8_9STAP|nr:nuclease-related domain-containing protein [Macrococcus lamae]TDM12115.1 NERD domain-containing protein [Macrococcus lamae]